jgi:Amt family ammonium transporter
MVSRRRRIEEPGPFGKKICSPRHFTSLHYSYDDDTRDLGYTMNGCLTGLVAITAGCATVETWVAVIIGIFAGIFYLMGSFLLVRLRIDDAVDAIPVHMVGGAWGVISTGLFSNPERMQVAFGLGEHSGWFYEWSQGSGDFTLMGIQLIAVLFIFAWTGVTMGAFFYVLNMLGLLRIDPLEEEVGMDISRHKGSAYDMDGSATASKVEQLNTSRRKLNIEAEEHSGEQQKAILKEEKDNNSAEKSEVEAA